MHIQGAHCSMMPLVSFLTSIRRTRRRPPEVKSKLPSDSCLFHCDRYDFPPRLQACSEVIRLVKSHPFHRIIVGVDNLGKGDQLPSNCHDANGVQADFNMSYAAFQSIMHVMGTLQRSCWQQWQRLQGREYSCRLAALRPSLCWACLPSSSSHLTTPRPALSPCHGIRHGASIYTRSFGNIPPSSLYF